MTTDLTVSSGTLRPQDLIPAFLNELKERDFDQYVAFMTTPFTAIPAHVQDEGDDAEWWTSEDAMHLMVELQDALQDCAPDGYYFGCHEGDGSLFGYWKEDTLREA